jgi:hypothetical protein
MERTSELRDLQRTAEEMDYTRGLVDVICRNGFPAKLGQELAWSHIGLDDYLMALRIAKKIVVGPELDRFAYTLTAYMAHYRHWVDELVQRRVALEIEGLLKP